MDFGKSLVNIRKEKGISRKDFAERLQIPYTTLRNYETGQREPGHKLLIKMAAILHVSVDELIGYQPQNKKALGAADKNDITLTEDERQLSKDYRALNDQGQEYIRQTMYMATQIYKKIPDLSSVEKQA